jgi:hypothetical protein
MKRQSLLSLLATLVAALIISWNLVQAPLAAAADEFPHVPPGSIIAVAP